MCMGYSSCAIEGQGQRSRLGSGLWSQFKTRSVGRRSSVVYCAVDCSEPSFEDSDAYIDTWHESLGKTVVSTQPQKSGCKIPPPLKPGQSILPRYVSLSLSSLPPSSNSHVAWWRNSYGEFDLYTVRPFHYSEWPWASCSHTHTYTRASVTNQYNLLPVARQRCPATGKVIVGLASHWLRVVDFSCLTITGMMAYVIGRWTSDQHSSYDR